MRGYVRGLKWRDTLVDIRCAFAPAKANIKTKIVHRRRKILGNERTIGIVLYKGTITRKGVRALELVDVPF